MIPLPARLSHSLHRIRHTHHRDGGPGRDGAAPRMSFRYGMDVSFTLTALFGARRAAAAAGSEAGRIRVRRWTIEHVFGTLNLRRIAFLDVRNFLPGSAGVEGAMGGDWRLRQPGGGRPQRTSRTPRRWHTLRPMEAAIFYRFHIALRGISPKIWRRV